MSLLLVNIISTLMAAVSMIIFIVISRRTVQTVQLGRAIAHQIADASATLDRALHALQGEHDEFRGENRKLDTRIVDATRARHEITRSVEQLNLVRAQLQSELRALRLAVTAAKTPAIAPATTNTAPPAFVTSVKAAAPRATEPVVLPAFVKRTVRLGQSLNLATQI